MAFIFVLMLSALPACASVAPPDGPVPPGVVTVSVLANDTGSIAASKKSTYELCGSVRISSILRFGEQVDPANVKNIPFPEVYKIADKHIDSQTSVLKTLTSKLTTMQADWYKQSTVSNAPRTRLHDSDLRRHIEEALQAAFRSVAEASNKNCILTEDENAYSAAETHFEAEMKGLFAKSSVFVDGSDVKRSCSQLLIDAGDASKHSELDNGWCEELCNSFSAKASSLSERAATDSRPGMSSAGELFDDMDRTRQQVDMVRTDIADCQRARDGIATFDKRLNTIGAEHDLNSRLSRNIQENLRHLSACLEETEKSSRDQKRTLDSLTKVIEQTNVKSRQFDDSLAKNSAHQAQLYKEISKSKDGMNSLRDALSVSRKLVTALGSFHALSIGAVQRFMQIYNDAVGEPLRELGLPPIVERLKRDDMWPSTHLDHKRWESPRKLIQDLQADCTAVVDATESFCEGVSDVAQEEADLMCSVRRILQDACRKKDYVPGIQQAVAGRQHVVRQYVENLRSYIVVASDDYHVLRGTDFYKDFAAHWDNDGTFQWMTLAVKQTVQQMEQDVRTFLELLKSLESQLDKSISEDAQLHSQLTAASKTLVAEKSGETQIQTHIDGYQTEMENKKGQLNQLRKQLADLTASLNKIPERLRQQLKSFQQAAARSFKEAPPDIHIKVSVTDVGNNVTDVGNHSMAELPK